MINQKYGKLTDDNLASTEGKFDEMLKRLQKKQAISKKSSKANR